MNSALKYVLLTSILASASLAVESPAPVPPGPATPPAAGGNLAPDREPGRGQFGGPRRAMMRRKLYRQLDVTAEQRQKLDSLRKATHDSVAAIRADASLSDDQKKQKIKDTMTACRQEMHAVLTPEQQARLKEIRGRARRHSEL